MVLLLTPSVLVYLNDSLGYALVAMCSQAACEIGLKIFTVWAMRRAYAYYNKAIDGELEMNR
jgi:hypothetical protein